MDTVVEADDKISLVTIWILVLIFDLFSYLVVSRVLSLLDCSISATMVCKHASIPLSFAKS